MAKPTTGKAGEYNDFYKTLDVRESDLSPNLATLRQKLRVKAWYIHINALGLIYL